MIFHCSAEFTIVQERRMCYTEIPCGHSGISRGAEPGCWHLSEGFTTLFSARSPPKNKICACDGIGRHARFRFSCSNACGFESLQAHHVVADFISFATTFYFKVIAHSFRRSSFPNRTRFAGLRFGFGCRLESWRIKTVHAFHVGASCISLALTFFQKVRARSFRCSSFPNHNRFAGL